MNLQLEYLEPLPGKLELQIEAVLQHYLCSLHIQSHRHGHREETWEESDSDSNQQNEEQILQEAQLHHFCLKQNKNVKLFRNTEFPTRILKEFQ